MEKETLPENGSEKQNEQEEKVKKNFKETYGSLKSYLLHLLDIRDETDRDATIEAILKDITFRGHNAWILIFSIIIASVGLNVGSTAVIIGAMLISPLMGPIVGLGFSVAINDLDTLKRSLINLGVMVALSLITASIYFWISPLTELTEPNDELMSRTSPTILDVLIAIFGGLALIIAKTKKGTIATVIMGVAIATALMPPLCTAGYGIAIWDAKVFGGALYLFTINTIFISISTFAVSKLLRFPMVRYANSLRRKRISQIVYFVAIAGLIPSIFYFYSLLQKSYFQNSANRFIKTELAIYKGAYLQKKSIDIVYDKNGESYIEAPFIGKEIPDEVITLWKSKMQEDKNLADTKLVILQNKNSEVFNEYKYLKELKTRDSIIILNQNNLITDLTKKYDSLSLKVSKSEIPFDKIAKEIRLNYGKVTNVAYAEMLLDNNLRVDTIPTFRISWNDKLSYEDKLKFEEKLSKWLAFKIDTDKVDVEIKPISIVFEENQ